MNFPTQQQSNHQPAFGTRQTRVWWLTLLVLILLARAAWGQTPTPTTSSTIGPVAPFNINPTNVLSTGFAPFKFNLGVEGSQQPQDVDVAIKVLFTITLLTLAPSIILLMTCFTRIVIVLSFVRSALSLQGTPANQIIIGLALFITYFIMAPVWEKIDTNALQPYMAKTISSSQALDEAAKPIREFMLRKVLGEIFMHGDGLALLA